MPCNQVFSCKVLGKQRDKEFDHKGLTDEVDNMGTIGAAPTGLVKIRVAAADGLDDRAPNVIAMVDDAIGIYGLYCGH